MADMPYEEMMRRLRNHYILLWEAKNYGGGARIGQVYCEPVATAIEQAIKLLEHIEIAQLIAERKNEPATITLEDALRKEGEEMSHGG